jgi:glycosyltransferase involved in cell wall biosynthesis
MRILVAAPAFFPDSFGGCEVYVYRIAKELLRRGHDITVLTPVQWERGNDPYVIRRYSYDDIPVISFSLNPEAISIAERYTGFGPLTSRVLHKILHESSPEMTHINGMKPAMVNLCSEMGIPHVVTAHHMGIACPSGALLRPDSSICNKPANPQDCVSCCSFSKRPKWYIGGILGRVPARIYRTLGQRINQSGNGSYLKKGLMYPWLVEQSIMAEKIVLEKARVIIAPSYSVKDLLVRNGCNPSGIAVMPHGIDPIDKLPFEEITGRPIRFGYMGRIHPSKGLHVLLKAAENLSDGSLCELYIFGAADGYFHDKYREKTLSDYQGKAKVIDHGLIHHNRLSEAFLKIDVLAVPSILPEAFGLVVAEAFSAGRPVIVSNSGALSEQVKHEVNGFIVERNDSRALSRTMQKFIDNPNLIYEMSKHVPDPKTMNEYVDEVEGIYESSMVSKERIRHHAFL